jgi:hypothetical protein
MASPRRGHALRRASPPSTAAAAAFALLSALSSTTSVDAAKYCSLNSEVNMSEVSLCGRNDWAEMLVASKTGCTFEKYRVIAGVYNCETGLAEARYFKTWPARLSKTVIGQSDGTFDYIVINGL